MQDRFAVTRFGRVHYLHGGAGEPLLLMHSNGGSAYDFEQVAERLGRNFELFAWDMPGQGDSDPLAAHLTIRQYAGAAVDFMDQVGIDRAAVLGASVGGAIAVALGASHPDRLRALFIVECPFRSGEEWQAQWPRIEANFALPVQTMDAVAPRLRDVSDDFLRRWNIDRCKAGSKTMMSVMWALRDYEAAADLPRVTPGAVVIYGDRGPTIANKDDFVGHLRDPRVEVMAGSGHFPMFDAPDEFCRLVERHARVKA